MNPKKHLMVLVSALAAVLTPFAACEKEPQVQQDRFEVSLSVPNSVDVNTDDRILTLSVLDGKAPEMTDRILFQSEQGTYIPGQLLEVSDKTVSILLPESFQAGRYLIFAKRGDRRIKVSGTQVEITFIKKIDFKPDPSTTVYGRVTCGDKPVEGVVISDGVEVTVTDAEGIYQLASLKDRGYVFMSVPSGYEALSKGILPQFSETLKAGAKVCERVDFHLKDAGDQTKYTMLMLGDMHLAKRTNDLAQFKNFTDEINAYLAAHKGEKIYALTLGDMTWDLYWYSNNFSFPEYLDVMNSSIKGLQIYHTIGNHDNDFKGLNDFMAESVYVRCIGPTYYSFNIGKVHYVVLDDINCDNYDGTESRNYFVNLTTAQLRWLEKDLGHVDKNTPVVMTTHAPVFNTQSWTMAFKKNFPEVNVLMEILKGRKVHIVTGHTHRVFNVTPDEIKGLTGTENIFEHNSGAICASWWWSGNLTPGMHLSTDGAHGGYGIWNIDGTDFKWLFKATGHPESHQFHTYDLNKVSFSLSDVPQMPAKFNAEFSKFTTAFPENSKNEVLLNVWNWNPSWKITVTDENGNKLEPVRVMTYDPQHIASMTVKRYNKSSLKSTPSFVTEKASHFFKVKAADAEVDLNIKVEDEFGRVWEQKMVRPQAFSAETCR